MKVNRLTKSFFNTSADKKQRDQNQSTDKKELNNQTVVRSPASTYLSDLNLNKRKEEEQNSKEIQTIFTTTSFNKNVVNLTLSQHLIYIFLQPNCTSEKTKINWLETHKQSKNLIAESDLLLYLHKFSTKDFQTSKVTFNRTPSDLKLLTSNNFDVIYVATISNQINKMVSFCNVAFENRNN